MKKTLADYPELVAQWHPTKNGDLKPSDVSYGSEKKIWWKCPVAEDHEWQASPDKRTSGKNCPCCAGQKVVLSNCLATTHPELVIQWHPIKNEITPNDVGAGSNKKVWWKCTVANDHEWQATIYNRTGNDSGCPCCSGRKTVLSNCLATLYPKYATQWHLTKNGSLTPYDVVCKSMKKVWWKCSAADDHEWETTIADRIHLQQGCPCCSGRKTVSSNCLATTHPELVNQWHPIRNKSLTPYDFVAGSVKKIWWICFKGHEWETSINKRTTREQNCPTCNESHGEKIIAEKLFKLAILFKRQWKFPSCKNKRPLPFDFVIKTLKGIKAIEYQGRQHYEPIGFGASKEKTEKMFASMQIHDAIKRDWCRQKNISLLEIPYFENNIEQLLEDFIND